MKTHIAIVMALACVSAFAQPKSPAAAQSKPPVAAERTGAGGSSTPAGGLKLQNDTQPHATPEQQAKNMLLKFDKDADNKLNEAELTEMIKEQQKVMEQMMKARQNQGQGGQKGTVPRTGGRK